MSDDTGLANLKHAAVLVDELMRRGVRHAVLCPGSRSTPLAVALATHPSIRTWVHIDERAAAFFALGMAREVDEPVALLCTSGTAAANFLPAVVEARLSRVPLIVLTADRPPELRDWGAPQTIDQLRLYGEHVLWFADLPVPTGEAALLRQTRAVAARAVATSCAEPHGPVHLNVPFREPLLPDEPDALTLFSLEGSIGHLGAGQTTTLTPDSAELETIAEIIGRNPRGLLVCGPGADPGLAAAATRFAATSGYPILADPLSGVRFGPHDHAAVLDAYDVFLRDSSVSVELAPEVVLQVGAIPTSKPLQQFLVKHAPRSYLLLDAGDPRDPHHLATDHLRADPATALNALADCLVQLNPSLDLSWRERWLRVDRETGLAIEEATTAGQEPFEGTALADVAAALPDGSTLIVGNSMPVRDADSFIRGDGRRIRIVGNRGANGIDGVVSSALGAAAVASGPTVLVIGDLSFYHDLNGLLAARRFDLSTTIVVLNNDGGGIFSFLPQAGQLDRATFETLFGTPVGLDVGAAARLFGASFSRPGDREGFRHSICRAIREEGLSVIEYVTDRERNVTQHRAVCAAVSRSLSDARVPPA